MVLSYHGLGMIKASIGDTTVVFNPIAEAPGLRASKFGADLALVSLNDPGYNGITQASRGDRVPFAVTGPGEYEVGGIFIKGVGTPGPGGRINTIYSLMWDGIKLIHLGVPATTEISPRDKEALGAVDILFVPLGAAGGLEAKAAAKFVTAFSPRLVIPVDYDERSSLPVFLKEVGAEGKSPVPSLSLKRKDLQDKETEVAVLALS